MAVKKEPLMGAASGNSRLNTTVAQELVLGITGLILVGFIGGHLAGNLLIFAGPDVFNGYADKLGALGGLLWVARIVLIVAIAIHIVIAVRLFLQNRGARGSRYAVATSLGRKTVVARFMLLSGIIVFCFLFLHIYDFTLADKVGAGTIVAGMNNGESLGLYGLVWNSFADPLHAAVYIVAVLAIGLHLSHAISSIFVTLGVLSEKGTRTMDIVALVVGMGTALGFASIPVYVLLRTYLLAGGSA